LSLRRGSSVLIGGAFEWLFCPKGREFEQANLFKSSNARGLPGGGGMLKFRIDRRINNVRVEKIWDKFRYTLQILEQCSCC